MIDSGRGAARAEDAPGTPTQSHISPSVLVYEDKLSASHLQHSTFRRSHCNFHSAPCTLLRGGVQPCACGEIPLCLAPCILYLSPPTTPCSGHLAGGCAPPCMPCIIVMPPCTSQLPPPSRSGKIPSPFWGQTLFHIPPFNFYSLHLAPCTFLLPPCSFHLTVFTFQVERHPFALRRAPCTL